MSTSTEDEVLGFMQGYQRRHGQGPKLDEIVREIPSLNGRPSALYVIEKLIRSGDVEAVKPKGFMRRYLPSGRSRYQTEDNQVP